MSYSNAIFYLDYELGSDSTRATLSGVVFSNPSGDVVRGTKTAHGLVTGAVIDVTGCTQAYANSAWKITKVTDDTFDLDGASWASFNGADVTGDAVPRGGQSWADAWKTITSGATAARIAAGDTVRIAKSSDPVSIGSCGWTKGSYTITLPANTTKLVNSGDSGSWTNQTGCTVQSGNTTNRRSASALSITTTSGVTSAQKLAHIAITELNLSGFQQLNFWMILSSSSGAITNFQVELCSDTAGDVAVNTFNIPSTSIQGGWIPIVIDFGSALGSSIKSITFRCSGTFASKTFWIDEIFVSKAPGNDAVTLNSFISISSSATEGDYDWYNIRYCGNDTAVLDVAGSGVMSSRGTRHETGSYTTYQRGVIQTTQAGTTTTVVQEVTDSGSSGSLITFSGGWNTSTSLQDGVTIFDGQNFFGYGLQINGKNYIKTEGLGFVRYGQGMTVQTGYCMLSDLNFFCLCTNAGYGAYMRGLVWSTFYCRFLIGNASAGLTLYDFNQFSYFDVYSCSSNGLGSASGFIIQAVNNTKNIVKFTYSCYNYSYGGAAGNGWRYTLVKGGETCGNGTSAFSSGVGGGFFRDCLFSEASFMTSSMSDEWTFSYNHDQVAGTIAAWTYGANAEFQNSVVHTSGNAWKINVTSAGYKHVDRPVRFMLAKVAFVANKQVTVKAWLRRTHASNITVGIMTMGNYVNGVASDVKTDMTAAADTWEEVSISFTPTEANATEIFLTCWSTGTTYSVYVDDLTIEQAA